MNQCLTYTDSGSPQLPVTFPLPTTSFEEALDIQQRLVAAAVRHFPSAGLFNADVGVSPVLGRPAATARVEKVLADAFGTEAAVLVQGAGTGAIRSALSGGPWAEGDRRLIAHTAPDYSTTATTLHDGAVQTTRVDFNNETELDRIFSASGSPRWVYLQHSRQQLCDSYDPADVIDRATAVGKRVIVDDNYAAFRTPRVGTQMGASASAFSLFKLHGPEGMGVVVGDEDIVERIHKANYSGGLQVQGHQALDSLRALVMVPLNWAAQSQACSDLVKRLKGGDVPGITDAVIANAQDRCVLALLNRPQAKELPEVASHFGASPFPVGANSRYEITPMVYRLSSSVLAAQPELASWVVRINPMRAGADLVVSILVDAMAKLSR